MPFPHSILDLSVHPNPAPSKTHLRTRPVERKMPAVKDESAGRHRGKTSPAIPSTFGGVAAVALRPFGCLLFWQIAVATAAAFVVAWSASIAWAKGFHRAALAVPSEGLIEQGRLQWPDRRAVVLHEDGFVSLVIDPEARRDAGLASDVGLSLEGRGIAARSVLGWISIPYPPEFRLRLNRVEATGLVAAWRVPVLIGLGFAVFFGLILAWWSLTTLYGILLWAFGGPVRRDLSFTEGWRLAGAALLPGAVLMTAAIGLYANRQLGIVGLLLAMPVHIVLGWLYCLGGLAAIPPLAPSAEEDSDDQDDAPSSPPRPGSPFRKPEADPRPRSNPFKSD